MEIMEKGEDLTDMTLNQLHYFETLARTQHYQRAAELLGISQPTLSRAINSLELELGAPLFERRGRNVALSRFGRVFSEHVFTAMHELNTGIHHVQDLTDPQKGSIDISLNYAVSNIYLPRLLKGYLDSNPDVHAAFQFRQSNTPSVLNDVREGMSEIGFCSYMHDQPEIRFYPLVRCPLFLLLPRDHPLVRNQSITLRDISRYPLILSVDETRYLENLLLSRGMTPIVACRMGEDRSIANLVACGFGTAILPYDPQLTVTRAVLRPIHDACAYRDFYMVISRTRPLSSPAKLFRDYVLSAIQSGQIGTVPVDALSRESQGPDPGADGVGK